MHCANAAWLRLDTTANAKTSEVMNLVRFFLTSIEELGVSIIFICMLLLVIIVSRRFQVDYFRCELRHLEKLTAKQMRALLAFVKTDAWRWLQNT